MATGEASSELRAPDSSMMEDFTRAETSYADNCDR